MKFVILLLIAVLTISCAEAETWTVFEMDPSWTPSEDDPRHLTFTFSDGMLSLNDYATSVGGGGSSTRVWELLFAGDWAVTGTIDESENLIRDPYATFIYDGYGGHINWASDTPYGYTTSLLLGYQFNGDGAATYQNYAWGEPVGDPVTGTLVLWDYLARLPLESDTYTSKSHEFTATFVPEPSSLLTLASCLLPVGVAVMRRRRK